MSIHLVNLFYIMGHFAKMFTSKGSSSKFEDNPANLHLNPTHFLTWLIFLTSEYMQRKKKSQKGGSYSTLSLLRKELREGNLQSLLGGSSCIVSSSNSADPLLSSFILPLANEHTSSQPHLHTEGRSSKKGSDESVSTRYIYFSYISFSKNFYFLFMEFCLVLQRCPLYLY